MCIRDRFIYKEAAPTYPGSGDRQQGHSPVQRHDLRGKAQYRGTQAKTPAATAACTAGAGSGGHWAGTARGGWKGGGKGANGCDHAEDRMSCTYSARPRRMARQQAIRANGATRGAAHVTAGSREKGTCPSVRRERRVRRRWPDGGADGAKQIHYDGEELSLIHISEPTRPY